MKIAKLYLLMAVLTAIGACSQKGGEYPSGQVATATDSLTVQRDSLCIAVTLKTHFTAADTAMQHSLALFLAEQVFYVDDPEATPIVPPPYNGSFEGYLQACVARRWQELHTDIFANGPTDDELPTPEQLADDSVSLATCELVCHKAFETDDLITWVSSSYLHVSATAYPSLNEAGITIRKTDGKPLGHELLADTDTRPFQQLLKKALRRWVTDEVGEQADTDEQLKSYLAGESPDTNDLPLPRLRPYLMPEGVALPYQPDELVSSNCPVVLLLPTDDVEPFLNLK